jgi:hypothetical protein
MLFILATLLATREHLTLNLQLRSFKLLNLYCVGKQRIAPKHSKTFAKPFTGTGNDHGSCEKN